MNLSDAINELRGAIALVLCHIAAEIYPDVEADEEWTDDDWAEIAARVQAQEEAEARLQQVPTLAELLTGWETTRPNRFSEF